MDDVKLGRALRALRIKKGLRQSDVAAMAGVSQQTVSRLEAGRLSRVSVRALRAVAGALGATILMELRWEGASLDRLMGSRHSAMHEALARMFGDLPSWVTSPETSFAVYGERGIIDVLAWHEPTRSLLVIEIKTELADLQETLGTLDKKVRLAAHAARERGWKPVTVSAWLVIADNTTNRDRVRAHEHLLRSALPSDGHALRAWLRAPGAPIRALSFLAAPTSRRSFAQVHKVRRPRSAAARTS